MNKCILLGRLTKDPEVKTTQGQVEVCSFTIAVDRKFKNAAGEREADFISCVAWRQQAKLLGQYFKKGSRILIVGSLQTRSYEDKDKKKVFVTELVVDEVEFVDAAPKKTDDAESNTAAAKNPPPAPSVDSGFYPTMDDDTTLPFDL